MPESRAPPPRTGCEPWHRWWDSDNRFFSGEWKSHYKHPDEFHVGSFDTQRIVSGIDASSTDWNPQRDFRTVDFRKQGSDPQDLRGIPMPIRPRNSKRYLPPPKTRVLRVARFSNSWR